MSSNTSSNKRVYKSLQMNCIKFEMRDRERQESSCGNVEGKINLHEGLSPILRESFGLNRWCDTRWTFSVGSAGRFSLPAFSYSSLASFGGVKQILRDVVIDRGRLTLKSSEYGCKFAGKKVFSKSQDGIRFILSPRSAKERHTSFRTLPWNKNIDGSQASSGALYIRKHRGNSD
ncbi:hypothetical protein Tco_1456224 [Tanacetum coccineum]